METEAGAQSLSPTEWNGVPTGGTVHRSSTLRGRDEELDELREQISDTRAFVVQGPRGSGTSALARELVSELRNRLNGRGSLAIHVDVSALNCPDGDPSYGVAAKLLQHFQQDAPVHGASRDRIMWWFLRRLMVVGRPVIVWLDQVRPNVRSLEGVVRPLMDPGVLLDDVQEIPPAFLVLSGNGDGGVETGAKCVHVPILPPETIREIAQDQARQLGRILAPGALTKVMDILATRGNSLSVMEEVLKAAVQRAGCQGTIAEKDVLPLKTKGRPHADMRVVNLHILETLRRAGGRLPMGELVRELSRCFARNGERTPSPGNVRRWIARLQSHGSVRRLVTVGGDGGTTSVVSLTTP